MYALIYDNKIQVGPRKWNDRVFRYEMDEQGFDTSELPISAPSTPIVTSEWKILPVSIDKPGYDDRYSQLAGPYLTINEDSVTGYYDIIDLPLHMSVQRVKGELAKNRYEVEVAGTEHTFADNETVGVYTNRGDRTTYLDAHQTLLDGQSITFKFRNGVFKTITKDELGDLINTGMVYIQTAFNWEKTVCDTIDAATNVDELRLIELRHPTQIPEPEEE